MKRFFTRLFEMAIGNTQVSIAGLRGTGDWGAQERPQDFREGILWYQPNGTAPLQALMSLMGSESLTDPEFHWWHEKQMPIIVKLDGAIADDVITTFTLHPGSEADSTGGFSLVAGDVLIVNSASGDPLGSEIVEVASVASDTSITVVRGAAGSTPAAIADGVYLRKIGNVFAEGTGAPNASFRNPVKYNNLAQIFKTVYDITETAKLTKARTGDPLKNDKMRKMFDHANALEYAYLFGRKHETIGSNGKPKRYTGGLLNFVSTNRHNILSDKSNWTEDTLLDMLSPVFDYDAGGAGNERLVFAGNGALNELNKLARNSSSTRINFEGTVKTYGMELMKWVLPQGTIYIKTHPLFNVDPTHRYTMLGINQSGLIERYMRKTAFKDNIQLPDEDKQKGQWLTEAGLEVHFEETFFALFNCGGVLPGVV